MRKTRFSYSLEERPQKLLQCAHPFLWFWQIYRLLFLFVLAFIFYSFFFFTFFTFTPGKFLLTSYYSSELSPCSVPVWTGGLTAQNMLFLWLFLCFPYKFLDLTLHQMWSNAIHCDTQVVKNCLDCQCMFDEGLFHPPVVLLTWAMNKRDFTSETYCDVTTDSGELTSTAPSVGGPSSTSLRPWKPIV